MSAEVNPRTSRCSTDGLFLSYKRLCVNKTCGRRGTRVLLSVCLGKRGRESSLSTNSPETLFDQYLCLFSSFASMFTFFPTFYQQMLLLQYYLEFGPLHVSYGMQTMETDMSVIPSSRLQRNIEKRSCRNDVFVLSKAIPVTDRGRPQVCETSKLQHCLDNQLTDDGEDFSLKRKLLFTPRNIPGTHFC
jgi:hypothetical protein